MAIWVCRTGISGQHESTYWENSCICLTREGFDYDLSENTKDEIVARICELKPDAAKQTISNTWSQINIFVEKMAIGDIVVIPKKKSHFINIAVVEGDYVYDGTKKFPMNHSRKIKVVARDVDASMFSQDIRYSLGAFRTVFGIRQEERFIAQLKDMGVSVDEV